MLTKNEVLKTIDDLPMEFSFEDILDRLLLLNKIEIGLAESAAGNVFSTEAAKEALNEWLK